MREMMQKLMGTGTQVTRDYKGIARKTLEYILVHCKATVVSGIHNFFDPHDSGQVTRQ